MSTFVSVGNANQPFTRLLDAITACADLLPKPIVVQHGHTPFNDPRCEGHAFLSMDQFVEQIRSAEVVIVHAGAGSVIHTIRERKVPVVMPRRAKYGEHVDDHQQELALALAEEGKLVVVDDVASLLSAVDKARAMQEKSGSKDIEIPPMVKVVENLLTALAADS
ncbi:glycosyltransferase [Mariprofundus sp. KV]|uniref:glycosyltransferase n=1 Tax=Mariprofundus sp. KV TaxID=2608715 RepID=UPI0015A46A3B